MMARNRKRHPMIGKQVRFTPSYMDTGRTEKHVTCTGVVVWVHPQERFVLIEYEGQSTPWRKGTKLHECMPWHLIPENKKKRPAGTNPNRAQKISEYPYDTSKEEKCQMKDRVLLRGFSDTDHGYFAQVDYQSEEITLSVAHSGGIALMFDEVADFARFVREVSIKMEDNV